MAVQNKTYNNIVDTLKELGKQHDQISTTTTGDIFDIDLEKNTKFPLMHINPINVATGQSTLTYNQSADNLSNNQEVLNDCLQICTDIVGVFRHSQWQSQLSLDINAPVYFGEGEFTFEPFEERFDNLLTGWVFPLSIIKLTIQLIPPKITYGL